MQANTRKALTMHCHMSKSNTEHETNEKLHITKLLTLRQLSQLDFNKRLNLEHTLFYFILKSLNVHIFDTYSLDIIPQNNCFQYCRVLV